MGINVAGNEKPRWVGLRYQCSHGHEFALAEEDGHLIDKSMLCTDYGNMSVMCPQDGCRERVTIPWFDISSNERLNQAMGKPSLLNKLKDFLQNPDQGWKSAGTWR